MATTPTREQRAADIERATAIITDAATAQGMSIVTSQDVVRVKDTDGTIVLSMYMPYWLTSNRFHVDGLFVPYVTGKIIGRSRFASKRTFWRSTAVTAAPEAVQYIRRQNVREALLAERDRVLRDRSDRPSKHDALGRHLSDSEVKSFAKVAYRAGFRTGDASIDNTVALAVAQDEERLSDSLWYDLLWNSFEPALRAVS
jgi:hypothetical protein